MKKLLQPIYFMFMRMKNKLAFYPSLIASWGIIFGIIMIYSEQAGISVYLQKFLPALVINDIDTARTILTTFIAGLISILVFSFSMVMILLNQAASNFSPRLLPGLISNKQHQSVLGIYLSGIFYCLIVLISIEPSDVDYQLPGFSVLLGIVIMTVSLAAFIYFVHSISQSIQVDHILNSIFTRAETRLSNLTSESSKVKFKEEDINQFKESHKWAPYYTDKSGFIQTFDNDGLCDLCEKFETKIEIIPTKNTFLLPHLPVFRSEKKLTEEQACCIFEKIMVDNTEPLDDNYVMSFKLITEIGIKAMSPGINDPGTASSCINYITQLLSLRMNKSDQSFIFTEGSAKIKLNTLEFEKLTYTIFAPFRAYCSHDVILVKKLLSSIRYLLSLPCEYKSYKKNLLNQAQYIINDAKLKLVNEQDKAAIKESENKLISNL